MVGTNLKAIQPLATMEEAWAESERLLDESYRLWDEADLVVTLTAQALFGKEAVIDWVERTVRK